MCVSRGQEEIGLMQRASALLENNKSKTMKINNMVFKKTNGDDKRTHKAN